MVFFSGAEAHDQGRLFLHLVHSWLSRPPSQSNLGRRWPARVGFSGQLGFYVCRTLAAVACPPVGRSPLS